MTPMEWLVFGLSTSVKALLVLTAAFALTRLMRGRSASERHLVWMLASICVLALPVLALATPRWAIDLPALRPASAVTPSPEPAVIGEARAGAAYHAAHVSTALGTPFLAPAAVARAHDGAHVAGSAIPTITPSAVAPAAPLPSAATARGSSAPDRSGIPLVLLCIWLMGSAVVMARIAHGSLHLRRITRRAQPLLDPALLVRMHGIAAHMHVTRPIRVLEGDVAVMPITFGIARATLLLPSSACTWSGARQGAVLRHELAHIRRRDSLSQLIVELGCALYWFNPLMWWASRRMSVEREHACDDAVLASGSRPTDYAAELLDIARTLRVQRGTTVAAIAMARQSHLRTRVASLLDPRPRSERTSVKLLVPAWIGAFLLITPLSSVAPDFGGRIPPAPAVETVSADAPTPAPDDLPQPGDENEIAAASNEAPLAVLSEVTPALAAAMVDLASMPAPWAWAAAPVNAQDACLSGGSASINSNSNDERQTIKWKGDDCSGEVVVEGEVQFDDAFTQIVGISRGGQFRVETDDGTAQRRVTITPANGALAYDYRVNGDRRELDAAGRQWLSSTMVFLFRRLGYMARERATAILQRGGTAALLAEVGLLHGDHTRARYLATLIERGGLDEATLNRVLTLAGNTIDSDHYRTEIITAVAGNYEFTNGVRDAYIGAISGMDSDHYRHEALSRLLQKGRLTAPQISAVLRETQRIDSDHYRAQLLEELADSYDSNPDIRTAYLEAAGGMESDHYKANVLSRLFSMGGMSDGERAQVVNAAATIDSDHYRADILTRVAQGGLKGAALQRAFMAAAHDIESDHYLQAVLLEVAAREDLDNATLLSLIEGAGSIESDHYQAELLVDIAKRHRLEGEARARVERLIQEMGSDTYRGRVAAALLSNGR